MTVWLYKSSNNHHTFDENVVIPINIQAESVAIIKNIISYDELISGSDFQSLSRFVFPLKKINGWPSVQSPFNVLGLSKNTGLKNPELASVFQQLWAISFIHYPHTTNFHDGLWMITAAPNMEVLLNKEPDRHNIPSRFTRAVGFARQEWHPKCAAQGPSEIKPNASAMIEFYYKDLHGTDTAANFVLSVRTTAGYLPKQSVQVVNGRASVKIVALGLEAGDEIIVKFDIGNYTNITNHTLTVG